MKLLIYYSFYFIYLILVPHEVQKRSLGSNGLPHFGHCAGITGGTFWLLLFCGILEPHLVQNFCPIFTVAPQFGHVGVTGSGSIGSCTGLGSSKENLSTGFSKLLPHWIQNFWFGLIGAPQYGQLSLTFSSTLIAGSSLAVANSFKLVPQLIQKACLSVIAAPQTGH